MYNKRSKSKPVDRLLRNFEIDSDDVELKMEAKITAEL
jgi:hypothetical protein